MGHSEHANAHLEHVNVEEEVAHTGEEQAEDKAHFEVGVSGQIVHSFGQDNEQDQAPNRKTFDDRRPDLPLGIEGGRGKVRDDGQEEGHQPNAVGR